MVGTRTLSRQLGVSRNTVLLVYDRLVAEGYLESRRTAGTFVSANLPEECLRLRRASRTDAGGERQVKRHPVAFRGRAQAVANPRRHMLAVDFWVGRPDRRSFPLKAWRRLIVRNIARDGGGLSEYGDPAGLLRLRRAIIDHLGPARGIVAAPEQVIVCNGCQQALNVVARLFVRPGSRVVVESPCYQGAAFLFESYGADLTFVPVTPEGIDVAALPAAPVEVAYVTPSHQYPLGVTLSLEGRLRLLDWAWRTGAYIVEDDYDSDFRYNGSPLTALTGLDTHGSVIYLGTFSKSIGAGLRLGYLVVPPELAGPAATIKALFDNGNSWLEQAALADFVASGQYERHLRRIRQTYLNRRDCLIEALHRHFGNVELSGLEGGMHLIWRLPEDFPPAVDLQHLAARHGVGIYSLPAGAAYEPEPGNHTDRAVMLGYSSLNEKQICDGVARVATVLAGERRATAPRTAIPPLGVGEAPTFAA
jgi:GntR family transcriptional regulator/MocR family aminotransferase